MAKAHKTLEHPLIGICSRPDEHPTHSVIDTHYSDAVRRAGGIPVALPFGYEAAELAEEIVERLDGLLLTGGGDIAPESFGGTPYAPHCTADIAYLSAERDVFEEAVARAAWDQDLPCLGICRGMQVMNVTLGGTLVRDVSELGGQKLVHSCYGRGCETIHDVAVEEGTQLADSVGAGQLPVNSMQHQAICGPAEGARISSWSTDGVIESFEFAARRFYLGVQWHPEWMESMAPLFEAFVAAARTSA